MHDSSLWAAGGQDWSLHTVQDLDHRQRQTGLEVSQPISTAEKKLKIYNIYKSNFFKKIIKYFLCVQFDYLKFYL